MSSLDQEERKLLETFEAGELKQTPNATDAQKRHQEYADAMLKKDAHINIPLSSKDLQGLW